MFGWWERRRDPDGAALAEAVAADVGKWSWSEVAWLLETGGPEAEVDFRGARRTVSISPDWDGDPWASDTWMPVFVSGAASGAPRRWNHRALTQHWGETLPDAPPSASPVDIDVDARLREIVRQLG